MLQVGGRRHRPLLTVGDRCEPMLRARRGHGRRGRRCSKPAGDGHQLGRRVRVVLRDHLLAGKPPRAARQRSGGVEPDARLLRRPMSQREGRPTCDSDSPAVTAGAHRGSAVSMPRGPGADRGQNRPAVPGRPSPAPGRAWRAGRWSALAASRSGLRKIQLYSGRLVAIPADWPIASDTGNLRKLLNSTQLQYLC
jgi:hypothetical protein